MKKFKINPEKEQKEKLVYILFYFFLISFVVKTVFGFMTDSKCLLVTGIFSIFGILMAVVTLMRLDGGVHFSSASNARKFVHSLNQGKLESIIMFGICVVIAMSTMELIFSTGHMVILHALYPPQIQAAWIAAFFAVVSFVLMEWMSHQLDKVPEGEKEEIMFILQADFIFSIFTAIAIILSRMGAYILDYAFALFGCIFIIVYSAKFLYGAFKGLMDASCDKKTIDQIRMSLKPFEAEYQVNSLRVSKNGHVIEIILYLITPTDMLVSDIKAKIEEIQKTLEEKLSKPCQTYVGIVQKI